MSRFITRKPSLDFAPGVIRKDRMAPVAAIAVVVYLCAAIIYLWGWQ